MADAKRPTAQDIEDARKVVGATVDNVARACIDMGDPKILINSVSRWRPVLRALDYAADCLRAEEEVEAPEDAGDDGPDDGDGWIPWEGGECPVPEGVVVEVVDRDGYRWNMEAGCHNWRHTGCDWDVVRYRLAQPSKPPTDPEARVRAMSDEEVEAVLTGRGVEGWAFSRRCYGWPISDDGRLEVVQVAIDEFGQCWTRDCGDGSVGGRFDDVTGDTTTPEGRAECSRRLLVHLLREEVTRG